MVASFQGPVSSVSTKGLNGSDGAPKYKTDEQGRVVDEEPRRKLEFQRHFTKYNTPVEDMFKWKKVDAVLRDKDGKETFRQDGVEAPEAWSQRAINIVAEKYMRFVGGVRETSVRQVIGRITRFLAEQGVRQGLFDDLTALIYKDEMTFMMLDQRWAFNSPVWFNVGVVDKPQSSACFIAGIDDTMESILELERQEVMLFKQGSGVGNNLSKLRSSYEGITGGGFASGPVSYMKPLDKNAGVTKSGGTTRRAAVMRVLEMSHPDILEARDGTPGFIRCKTAAEQVAHDLYSTGKYTAEFNVPGNVYDLVDYQNANHSVRCTDEFMQAVKDGGVSYTFDVKTGAKRHEYQAKHLWREIAEAAWFCGDPGVQFHGTTNKWHTCKQSGNIRASNPCGEFLYLDDTSCNLGSWNLLKFWDGVKFDCDGFMRANRLAITGMEILVDASGYPSEKIAQNSHDFRPLGIGFTNLGALLMYLGYGYDSDEGRAVAASITALMSGICYEQSARIAQLVGPFPRFEENREPMLDVIRMHRDAAYEMKAVPSKFMDVLGWARTAWVGALELGERVGFRNGQISVEPPAGTISFAMDCETTGCEPMLDIIVYKKLVGGGLLKMPNNAVEPALKALGYTDLQIAEMLQSFDLCGGLLGLKKEHKAVFQTAIGSDPVSVEGHLCMMAAIQPFLSGGISKTVNVPSFTTVEEIENIYMRAWELGLKCVAIFRDGCKLSQPIASKATDNSKAGPKTEVPVGLRWGERKRLADERMSVTHKAVVGGQDLYVHVGLNEDGTPGELFIDVAKAGSTLHGLLDAMSIAVSMGLQHGVPLAALVDKLKDMKFAPDGLTRNKEIPFAASLVDYVAKWLEKRFLSPVEAPAPVPVPTSVAVSPSLPRTTTRKTSQSGPPCSKCGNLSVRVGSCWCCTSCGTTSGCS